MRYAFSSMRKVSLVVGLLGVLAGLVVAPDASAFCRSTTCRSTSKTPCDTDDDGCPIDGAKLYWPTSCVSWAMNRLGTQDLDPNDTRAAIRKAFQAWTEVPCPGGGNASMTFQEREPVACKKSEYNKNGPNVNVILFQDDNWTYRGIDGTLAKTSVTYNDTTGEIYDADIEVNAANNTVTITDDVAKIDYDLQAILTHEAGHFIGIAHSPDPSAVMFASYNPGSTSQRTLTDDDVAAVCAAYPPNDGVTCNTEPRGGFSGTCDDPPSGGICSASPAEPASGSSGGGLLGALVIGAVTVIRARRGNR
jgi:MYXO-CTERM domain-containing protein